MTEATVIVRAKDEERSIERALSALRRQSVDPEIVVVDSGSTDGTLAIARRYADRIIEIRPEEFSFGRSLNIGARAASAPIHFALSAHCAPETDDWIERTLGHYERPDVAAVNGALSLPNGRLRLEVVHESDAGAARARPFDGFSNHASSWRASVWEQHPFDEQLEACEDKEWAWRVQDAGWVVVYDPLFWVSLAHRRQSGLRAYYERVKREASALARVGALKPMSARDALAEWWSGFPEGSPYPTAFHRLNYMRAAEIAGRWRGSR
jgi:rhamnosyltransferase